MSYVSIAFHIIRFREVRKLINKINSEDLDDEFISFETIAHINEINIKINAATLFFVYTKIFKYVTLNKRLSYLTDTLKQSGREISSYLIIFFIFFFAYASIGYLIFGSKLSKFRSYFDSL